MLGGNDVVNYWYGGVVCNMDFGVEGGVWCVLYSWLVGWGLIFGWVVCGGWVCSLVVRFRF